MRKYLLIILILTGALLASAISPVLRWRDSAATALNPELWLKEFASVTTDDPYLWLEEIEGDRALAWVKARNQATKDKYQSRPEFQDIYQRTLSILDSPEKLLYPRILGPDVYNFWRDEKHQRGLIRRQPLDQFLSASDDWETVLDIDALAETEGENWVFKGHAPLAPNYGRTLIWLSRGGSDAAVLREFDLTEKRFVPDGFRLKEAKSNVAWRDPDSVYAATDFGPDSMTDSGYPRFLKLWKRGTPVTSAQTVLEVSKKDLGVSAWVSRRAEGQYHFVSRTIDMWNSERFLIVDGELRKLAIPADASLGPVFKGNLILILRSPWKRNRATYPTGCVLSLDIQDLLEGKASAKVLHNPQTDDGVVVGLSALADSVVVTLSQNVTTGLHRFRLSDGAWRSKPIEGSSGGTCSVAGHTNTTNDFFFTYQNWLNPTTMNYLSDGKVKQIQRLPASFPSEGLVSEQHWATSADGTKVPYYVIRSKDLEYDGTSPTLLYGYGGFTVSILPSYLSLIGPAWLERGGVYVSANIRGGGEFGPNWHQAALRENRPRAFEDFEAVAEDLIAKGITSPQHLGIHGRSNGGLLTGATLMRRPDLYGAVLVGVPLLDMQRYHKLLAGASWVAEYGNPDKPEDWAFLKEYSPYHNIKPLEDYPAPLFYTSTKDDRVHPGHARKMAAKMMALGHEVEYYENLEGGHAGSSNNPQTAFLTALSYSYLLEHLRVNP